MQKSGFQWKIRNSVFILLLLSASLVYGQDNREVSSTYQGLISRLSKEGFDSGYLSRLFADPRAEPIPNRMVISVITREIPEIYAKFLTFEANLLARNFLRQNLNALREMEKRFDVEMEVAVAILLVESRFGENIGKHRVIPTLASMAIMDSKENLLKNYASIWEANPEIPFDLIESLASRRANWAYKELRVFLEIVRPEKMDPLEVNGSIAGALGMPQFIPSSFVAYAMNKNSFKDWLYDPEAAILSIGNYLRSHGWKKGLPFSKQKQLLWHYNRSDPYGETILEVARRLKK